jgi:hypothetical protein
MYYSDYYTAACILQKYTIAWHSLVVVLQVGDLLCVHVLHTQMNSEIQKNKHYVDIGAATTVKPTLHVPRSPTQEPMATQHETTLDSM